MSDITYLTHVKFDHGMIAALTGELAALGEASSACQRPRP